MPENERDAEILRHICEYCEDIRAAVLRFGSTYEAFCHSKL